MSWCECGGTLCGSKPHKHKSCKVDETTWHLSPLCTKWGFTRLHFNPGISSSPPVCSHNGPQSTLTAPAWCFCWCSATLLTWENNGHPSPSASRTPSLNNIIPLVMWQMTSGGWVKSSSNPSPSYNPELIKPCTVFYQNIGFLFNQLFWTSHLFQAMTHEVNTF